MNKRIIVTGAAGFIGSNIVKALNARGITDIIAVDNLTNADKFSNLIDAKIIDYIDKTVFYEKFQNAAFGCIDTVFHEGACSNTMERDGRYMLSNNYTTSKIMLDTCLASGTRLLYASSAATYGRSTEFAEIPKFERPRNVYGYSKLLFDQIVRTRFPVAPNQVVGLRYFNVYGPGEYHKKRMASVAFHHYNQFCAEGKVKLFGPYNGYDAGEQKRDFIFVNDVAAVNMWFFEHPDVSGIFNLGTGHAQPFNDIAMTVINTLRASQKQPALTLQQMIEQHLLEYVPFPDDLVGKYQCFTEADLTTLRNAGCQHVFSDVSQGVKTYVEHLLATQDDRN